MTPTHPHHVRHPGVSRHGMLTGVVTHDADVCSHVVFLLFALNQGPMAFPTTKVAIKAGVGVWEMARV